MQKRTITTPTRRPTVTFSPHHCIITSWYRYQPLEATAYRFKNMSNQEKHIQTRRYSVTHTMHHAVCEWLSHEQVAPHSRISSPVYEVCLWKCVNVTTVGEPKWDAGGVKGTARMLSPFRKWLWTHENRRPGTKDGWLVDKWCAECWNDVRKWAAKQTADTFDALPAIGRLVAGGLGQSDPLPRVIVYFYSSAICVRHSKGRLKAEIWP